MEKKCFSIVVYSDSEGEFSIFDAWSKQKSRDINDYAFDSEEVGVHLDYRSDFYLKDNSSQEFCFYSDNGGKYYGVLVLSQKDKLVSAGVWLELNVKNKEVYSSISAFANLDPILKSKPSPLAAIFVLTVCNLIALAFLLRKLILS